jgi:Protein of unknown function (DUF1812).
MVFTSCTDDSSVDCIDCIEEEKKVEVHFEASIPSIKVSSSASTRATTETEIQNIKVLVFDKNNEFSYMVDGLMKSSESESVSFDARLITSSTKITLYFIANAADIITSAGVPAVKTPLAQVKTKYNIAFSTAGINKNFPMVGQVVLNNLTATSKNTITGIKMLRSIARTDVLVDTQIATSKFQLVDARLYRANSLIQIMPSSDPIWTSPNVSSPSVPASSTISITTSPVMATTNKIEGKLYLPESTLVTNDNDYLSKATSIVIGGKFNGSPTVTYYRIDFNPPFGQVLRNHNYIFTINSVTAAGWSTPAEAATNASSNIAADVKVWDASNTYTAIDGLYYFGVSTRTVQLPPLINSTVDILVDTNLDSYTAEWTDASGTGSGNSVTQGQSLNDGTFSVSLSADKKTIRVKALKNSQASTTLSQNILIKAKRFNIVINISQKLASNSSGVVNLMTIKGELGNLGSNELPSSLGWEIRGLALRNLLLKTDNFGSGANSKVKVAGFNLAQTPESPGDNLRLPLINNFDILFIPECVPALGAANSVPAILNWLNAQNNRYLVFNFERASAPGYYNYALLSALGIKVSDVVFYNLTNLNLDKYTYVSNNITDNGAFGTVAANFNFRNYDAWHAEIKSGKYPNIKPILKGANGGIVLGIDETRRVVYFGDIDLFHPVDGAGPQAGERLVIDGTVSTSNNASKMVANLWEYISQVVLTE